MRVVLDTNVFISALSPTNSPPSVILDLWRVGEIELLVSIDVLAEYRRVLTYSKVRKMLRLTHAEIDEVFDLITVAGTHVEVQLTLDVVAADPSDNKFIELAVAGSAAVLVSGDKHLLSVGRYHNFLILKPQEFIALYHHR